MSRCMIPSIQVLAIEDEKFPSAEEDNIMLKLVLLSPILLLLSTAASATRPTYIHSSLSIEILED